MSREFGKADIVYVGIDGSRWNLSGENWGDQGAYLGRQPRGLYSASGSAIWNQGAFQEGATFEGLRWEPRDMVFEIVLEAFSDVDFEEVYTRWQSAWSFVKQGHLEYTSKTSGTRVLPVQLLEVSEFEPEFDPRLNGHGVLVMTIRAGKPWWRSESDFDSWVFDGRNFAGDSVTVWNPTDRPLRLRWALTGPARFILPDFDFDNSDGEQGERMVRIPFIRYGWEATVNTDPHKMAITCPQNENLWAQMGGQQFEFEIPPHTPPTDIPVFVDPLPVLPFTVPPEWSMWLAEQLTVVLSNLPEGTIFDTTPEMMADWIKGIILTMTPDFLERWSLLFAEVIPNQIADWIVEAYGSMNNMAGASATVEMPREWMGPWGLSEEGAVR